eukprot:scaffold120717_cov63-Phaeocystis_antarctica.AAC.3
MAPTTATAVGTVVASRASKTPARRAHRTSVAAAFLPPRCARGARGRGPVSGARRPPAARVVRWKCHPPPRPPTVRSTSRRLRRHAQSAGVALAALVAMPSVVVDGVRVLAHVAPVAGFSPG